MVKNLLYSAESFIFVRYNGWIVPMAVRIKHNEIKEYAPIKNVTEHYCS